MQTTTERSCEDCSAPVLEGAQFCVACGASVAAPSTCPKCAAALPNSAKFCPACGGKVVGARPKVDVPSSPVEPAPVLAAPAGALPPSPPPRPRTGSSIGSNVLLFVAFLLVLVVVIYEMNKGAEKSVSPFAGGPAPNMGGAPPPSAPPAEAGGGEPIHGSVKIAASLGAPPAGTIFVILRNQGMPNKGPPLAVKRIESPSFPASFTLGPDDMMMKGLPFNGPFDIYVRLDADGDAMTKAPGDLTNEKPKSGVLPGAKDVEIELDQRL